MLCKQGVRGSIPLTSTILILPSELVLRVYAEMGDPPSLNPKIYSLRADARKFIRIAHRHRILIRDKTEARGDGASSQSFLKPRDSSIGDSCACRLRSLDELILDGHECYLDPIAALYRVEAIVSLAIQWSHRKIRAEFESSPGSHLFLQVEKFCVR